MVWQPGTLLPFSSGSPQWLISAHCDGDIKCVICKPSLNDNQTMTGILFFGVFLNNELRLYVR